MAGEPYEWREPNEDELKEIRERRARSDEISKIMSGYLLKGYRMLASHCNDCGNVLLDDKKGRTFCVSCDESGMPDRNVDHEKSLDNNVARASSSLERPTTPKISKHPPLVGFVDEPNETRIAQEAKNAILESMKNATAKLDSSQNAIECAEYANLIRSCADALCSLNKLKKTFVE